MRVGVTVLGSASGLTGEAGRDRLVKDLNKQKKSEVQAVPLTASAGDQISEEARQKNCQFVVFTTQTESHAESHNEGGEGAGRAPISRNTTPTWNTRCTGSPTRHPRGDRFRQGA